MLSRSNRYHRCVRGFTLIEIMVVIVIMSVLFGTVMLSIDMGGGDDRKIKEEARRLIALIKLAQEEAIFQSREYGLAFGLKDYGFFIMTPGGWRSIDGDKTFRRRKLPESLEFELILDGLDTDLKLNEKFEQPQIFIMSSGETSVFDITFNSKENFSYSFSVDALGKVKREDDEETDHAF